MPTSLAYRQHGQALTEATVVLTALTGLLWTVYATGSWQDESVRAGLAARQAAFAYSRGADVAPDGSLDANRGDADIHIKFVPMLPAGLPDNAQPGGAHPHAATLRRDWQVVESAVMVAYADVAVSADRGGVSAVPGNSRRFMRHTVVLRGAGHASGDAQAQARIADSGLGWQTPVQASMAAGQALAVRMQPVEQAWSRPVPEFDWLQKWMAITSPQVLQPGEP